MGAVRKALIVLFFGVGLLLALYHERAALVGLVVGGWFTLPVLSHAAIVEHRSPRTVVHPDDPVEWTWPGLGLDGDHLLVRHHHREHSVLGVPGRADEVHDLKSVATSVIVAGYDWILFPGTRQSHYLVLIVDANDRVLDHIDITRYRKQVSIRRGFDPLMTADESDGLTRFCRKAGLRLRGEAFSDAHALVRAFPGATRWAWAQTHQSSPFIISFGLVAALILIAAAK